MGTTFTPHIIQQNFYVSDLEYFSEHFIDENNRLQKMSAILKRVQVSWFDTWDPKHFFGMGVASFAGYISVKVLFGLGVIGLSLAQPLAIAIVVCLLVSACFFWVSRRSRSGQEYRNAKWTISILHESAQQWHEFFQKHPDAVARLRSKHFSEHEQKSVPLTPAHTALALAMKRVPLEQILSTEPQVTHS